MSVLFKATIISLILTYVTSLWFSKYFLGPVSNIVKEDRSFKTKTYLRYKMNEN